MKTNTKRKYGFNMRWICNTKSQPKSSPNPPNCKKLDFIAKHGFNFIRVPMDYTLWTKNFDYFNPDYKVLEIVDTYIEECNKRGIHICLNLAAAPGYSVNSSFKEKHVLWKDKEAQEAFVFLWEYFAERYKGISNKNLSFNLLNEPPELGRDGFTRDNHEYVMRTTISAIRAIDPSREIVLDGIQGAKWTIPELADTGTIHSCRGYCPLVISHWRCFPSVNWDELEPVVYPGVMKKGLGWNDYPMLSHFVENVRYDRDDLVKRFEPWVELEKKGVRIHVGEFGCYNKIHQDIALRWLGDLLSVFKENKWGYAMWNFEGPFGIVNHGRPGTVYTDMDGFKVDKALLGLMLENMVK